jgi:hypothetical protein
MLISGASAADRQAWDFNQVTNSGSTLVATIAGHAVYRDLKFENGVHRIQRVPTTEAKGRVHTSTASVLVLPQPEDVNVQINASDVDVETMRASGAGGQHVNTTDSAVRVTHRPTGIVVTCSVCPSSLECPHRTHSNIGGPAAYECPQRHILVKCPFSRKPTPPMQDQRSQHKNRAAALQVLAARVAAAERCAFLAPSLPSSAPARACLGWLVLETCYSLLLDRFCELQHEVKCPNYVQQCVLWYHRLLDCMARVWQMILLATRWKLFPILVSAPKCPQKTIWGTFVVHS